MRPETAPLIKQLQALQHEPSHQTAVQLLRHRLAELKNQLIDAEHETWMKVQGQARECRWMLQQLTGEHPRKDLAP